MVSRYLLHKPRKLKDALKDIARHKAVEQGVSARDGKSQPDIALDEQSVFSKAQAKKRA